MVAPINSLMNMEMQLYGGLGSNSAAPSYFNGYRAQSNNAIYSPSFYGYGNNGTIFCSDYPSGSGQGIFEIKFYMKFGHFLGT